jgi:hypothetical protein
MLISLGTLGPTACSERIPPGTILLVALNSSLNLRKSKAWQIVTARLMQDVPSSAGAKISARAKVVGYALDVTHQPLRAMPKSCSNSTRL